MNRPALKVYLKSARERQYVDLFAFWRGERGLTGTLDRSVVELAVTLEDGTTVRVRRDDQGRVDGWYINAREDGGRTPQRAPARAQRQPELPDVESDDDLPF
jgi:hypothetical protein